MALKPPSFALAWTLPLLLGLSPVATFLYLPTLPLVKRAFEISDAQAQLTLSLTVIGFTGGQLLFGPLADTAGRRPVIIGGLTLFILASAVAAGTSLFPILLICRLLQGFGMAAAGVGIHAMIRDVNAPGDSIRLMSIGLSGMGILSLIGPPIAAGLAEADGRTAAQWICCGYGTLALIWVWLGLAETTSPTRRSLSSFYSPRPLLTILRHRTFLIYSGLTAFSCTGNYMFLSASSFILIGPQRMTPVGYGLILAGSSLFYTLGTFACRHWLRLHGPIGSTSRAAGFSLAGGMLLLWPAIAAAAPLWPLILGEWVMTFGHAVHMSCGQAVVMGPFPNRAGTAFSISAFLVTALASAVSGVLGDALAGSERNLALAMFACACGTSIIGLFCVPPLGVGWISHVIDTARAPHQKRNVSEAEALPSSPHISGRSPSAVRSRSVART